jgi:hypothetical protein
MDAKARRRFGAVYRIANPYLQRVVAVTYRYALPVGTEITCENGHFICEVVIEYTLDGRNTSENFGNYAPTELPATPHAHMNDFICTDCSARWARFGPYEDARTDAYIIAGIKGPQLHTDTGWWPLLSDLIEHNRRKARK